MTDTLTIRAALAELLACTNAYLDAAANHSEASYLEDDEGIDEANRDAEDIYASLAVSLRAARLALTAGSAALAATEPAEPPDEQEREEEDRLRQRMSDLLTGVANALQGEPPLLTRWSWHDLPERAAAATELLRSARAIAQRQGAGTAWERFDASIGALGIGSVTARTYRVLPSEGAATVMPAAQPLLRDPKGGELAMEGFRWEIRQQIIALWRAMGEPDVGTEQTIELPRSPLSEVVKLAASRLAALRPTAPQPRVVAWRADVKAPVVPGGAPVWRAGELFSIEPNTPNVRNVEPLVRLSDVRPSPTSSAPAEPLAILARMVEMAPFTSFLGAYVNEWNDLIGRAALASSIPPEQQREHKGLS